MKAQDITPGSFLDLKVEGLTLPPLQASGSGRRHVPNWVRKVENKRKYTYLTLGDYRVLTVDREREMSLRSPYCVCGSRIFLCPAHRPLSV